MDKVLYHASTKRLEKIEPFLHVGSLETAENRAEMLNIGNEVVYNKVKISPDAKIYKTSDMIANIYASSKKGYAIELGSNRLEVDKIDIENPDVLEYENEIEEGVSYMIINPDAAEIIDLPAKLHLGGEVESLISEGIVELNIYDTTPEHAKEYRIYVEKPLFVQNICVDENERLKGIGKGVLDYLDDYARKNGNDVIFGHIAEKASFTKDSRQSHFCDVDMIKNWLHNNGYAVNDENNDFHKVVEFKDGGEALKGGNADRLDLETIALIHDVELSELKKQFEKGVKVEMEHTSDKKIASEICLDHLAESPVYYDLLEDMEKKFENGGIVNASYLHVEGVVNSMGQKVYKIKFDINSVKDIFVPKESNIGENNFYKYTICNWKSVDMKDFEADYISDSGSEYMYSKEGVYRRSDHFGCNISTCIWLLDGEYHVSNDAVIGFCKYVDFFTYFKEHNQNAQIDKREAMFLSDLLQKAICDNEFIWMHSVERYLQINNDVKQSINVKQNLASNGLRINYVNDNLIFENGGSVNGNYTKEDFQREESKKQFRKALDVMNFFKENGIEVSSAPSRSITNFGVSTYFNVYTPYTTEKFRISDHEVTNIDRVWNEIHYGYNDTPELLLESHLRRHKKDSENARIRKEMYANERDKRNALIDYWNSISDYFQGLEFKRVGRTYQGLEKHLSNKPNAKNVYQKDAGGGAFYYEWTEPINKDVIYRPNLKPSLDYIENYLMKHYKQGSKLSEKKEINMDYNSVQMNMFNEQEKTNTPSLFSSNNGKRTFEYGGSITDIGKWDDVPNEWRNISKVSPLKFEPNVTDKNFQKLMKSFVGNDSLRPVMTGVYYTESQICATDAHKLILLPNNTGKMGLFTLFDNKKEDVKSGQEIDGKFPNYLAVIPDYSEKLKSYQVDVYKLLQFSQAAINYANQTTYQLQLRVDDEMVIGFKGRFLIQLLNSCLYLGYDKVWFHFTEPSRAIVITPEKEYDKENTIGFLMLVMPVMLLRDYGTGDVDATKYSAIDVDFNHSLMVNFDFSKNEIVNADGSIAKFKMDYGKGELFKEDDVSLLKKVAPNKSAIYIIEKICVRDGYFLATDLETSIRIKQTKAKDGVYSVLNNVPYIDSSQEVDDFPLFPKVEGKKIFSIDRSFFQWIVDRAENFVGNDDLRPIMKGINISSKNGLCLLAATDATALIRYNISDYLTELVAEDFSYTFPTKALKSFLLYAKGDKIDVVVNDSNNVIFSCQGADLAYRLLDDNYPNYNAVFPEETTKSITVDLSEIKKAISSKEYKSAKQQYKSDTISLMGELQDDGLLGLYIKVYASRGSYKSDLELKSSEKIAEIEVSYNPENYKTPDLNAVLVMPINTEHRDGVLISFNPNVLDTALSGIKTENITLYFRDTTRAYLIQGEALEYKAVSKKTPYVGRPSKRDITLANIGKNPPRAKVDEGISHVDSNRLILDKIRRYYPSVKYSFQTAKSGRGLKETVAEFQRSPQFNEEIISVDANILGKNYTIYSKYDGWNDDLSEKEKTKEQRIKDFLYEETSGFWFHPQNRGDINKMVSKSVQESADRNNAIRDLRVDVFLEMVKPKSVDIERNVNYAGTNTVVKISEKYGDFYLAKIIETPVVGAKSSWLILNDDFKVLYGHSKNKKDALDSLIGASGLDEKIWSDDRVVALEKKPYEYRYDWNELHNKLSDFERKLQSESVENINAPKASLKEDVKDSGCETGQENVTLSKVVNGRQISSLEKTVLSFDKAFDLKNFIEGIDGSKMSSVDVSNKKETGLSFKVPQWLYHNGEKLYFDYVKESDCPYRYVSIKQTEVSPNDTSLSEIIEGLKLLLPDDDIQDVIDGLMLLDDGKYEQGGEIKYEPISTPLN